MHCAVSAVSRSFAIHVTEADPCGTSSGLVMHALNSLSSMCGWARLAFDDGGGGASGTCGILVFVFDSGLPEERSISRPISHLTRCPNKQAGARFVSLHECRASRLKFSSSQDDT